MKRCMNCMEELDEGSVVCPHCGHDSAEIFPQDRNLPAGYLLADRYLLGRVLGSGGFGITYIAYDQLLGRRVAVKEFFPSDFATRQTGSTQLSVFTGDSAAFFDKTKESFIEEGRRLATFAKQGNIVAIYDAFEANGSAYIVMELLEGETVKSLLKTRGRLGFKEAMSIITPVLDALSLVHANGIVHRDVAPDNIFIRKDGSVVLIDFGAARNYVGGTAKSMTVVLKPGYAPVEQYRSKEKQGPWTDVYAAAATFYRMVTGLVPEESMQRAFEDTLKPPSFLGITLSQGVETALMAALSIEAETRIQGAEQLKAGLRGEPFDMPVSAQRSASFTPLETKAVAEQGSARKRSSLASVIAVVVVALTVGVGVLFTHFSLSQSKGEGVVQVRDGIIDRGAGDMIDSLGSGGVAGGGVTEEQEATESASLVLEVGDTYQLGVFEGEAIDWRVLKVEEGRALIITKNIVAKNNNNSTYWSDSIIRDWLNNDFYSAAFSEDEKSMISETTITTVSPQGYTDVTTHDFVFLLTRAQAEDLFESDGSRIATYDGESLWWWLDARENASGAAATCIDEDGDFVMAWAGSGQDRRDDFGGGWVELHGYGGIRPVLWLSVGA